MALRELGAGNRTAADRLLPLVYDELRELAERAMRRERANHTLQATAVVHDAYLRLINEKQVEWKDRKHFFAIAARAIRQILINSAKAHRAEKRGGGGGRVTLHDDRVPLADQALDVLALDEALNALAERSERQARIVELRFFGGLSVEETADLMEVSPRTVEGDWAFARAWLRSTLSKASAAAD
ncbi:MAG: sigma-70 family RNA polymerase sigma factor [Planctomycetes bacterium]|nr:sigma-70 family RNA polymerase sigma factor [Planctomycetota bacterium]